MPGGDRTGPQGFGSMTGRGAGFCAGYNMPGYMNRFGGGGFNRRGGGRGGRGFRNVYYATGMPGWMRYGQPGYNPQAVQGFQYSREDEAGFLNDQAEYLKNALEDVNKRLNALEKEEA